jgi:penicillin-binding protein 2
VHEIAPDEIFLDSSNLPGRDDPQFEGRIIRPVAGSAILTVGVVCALVLIVFTGRSFDLSIMRGAAYADISRDNRLDRSVLFAERGRILDRTGRELAWNSSASSTEDATTTPFSARRYSDDSGFSHLVGFVRYPKTDQNGVWWREEYAGVSGAELVFDDELQGENGSEMIETDAGGRVSRRNIVALPEAGEDVRLSIDAEVENKLHTILSAHAKAQGFRGGAAVIMDVHTGELLALVSFPEYDHAAFAEGDVKATTAAGANALSPLLNRATSGLYAPGSIVKPIFAAAALNEGLLTPDTKILSTGAITIPNPYDPAHPTIFRDWTVHGWVDMRTAIAVSSDEYFYTIGGGHGTQKGLGIAKLDEYAQRFGLGAETGIPLFGEEAGVIPTPEWKRQVFGPDDPWRIGNTYHTAIGQYGFQITPVQAVRFIAAVANGGSLLTPQIALDSPPHSTSVNIPDEYLKVVREGMRLGVTSDRKDATVKSLNIGGIHIAAKTGTAQIGAGNQWMNSWSVGFWPAENPRYAYAAVLEQAPAGTLSGAAPGLVPFFHWLITNHPEYVN